MDRASTEPVFWWWDEASGSRVVLLSDDILVLSGPLTRDSVAALEAARRNGALTAADFGSTSVDVALNDIERVRLIADDHQVILDLEDGRTKLTIEPPPESAGVAAGIFGELNTRCAPSSEPVDSMTIVMTESRTERWVVPTLLGLATLAAIAGTVINPLAFVAAGTLGAAGFAAFVSLGRPSGEVGVRKQARSFEVTEADHAARLPSPGERDLLEAYRADRRGTDPLADLRPELQPAAQDTKAAPAPPRPPAPPPTAAVSPAPARTVLPAVVPPVNTAPKPREAAPAPVAATQWETEPGPRDAPEDAAPRPAWGSAPEPVVEQVPPKQAKKAVAVDVTNLTPQAQARPAPQQ
jgi:hypothetical protein